MPFDSNGTFNRLRSWVSDAAANILIRSDYHDNHDQDIAAGLSTVITKDGRTQPTANLPMNNHRLINVQDPVAPQDVATKNYVDRLQTFTTSINISGADANGYVSFTAATGANGLSFTGADLSWLARLATAAGPGTPPNPAATLNRLVLNTKPDGSGTDVVTVNDDGSIAATGVITSNSAISANGAINATTMLTVKATSGNDHVWFYGPNNEDRMVIYTNAAAMSHGFLRVNGTQTYTFQNDGVFKAPAHVYAGASIHQNDGNIWGSVYGNDWLTNWVNARVNSRVGNVLMQRSGSTYSGNVGDTNGWICPAGTVIIGYARVAGQSGQVYGLYYTTLQIYDDIHGWRNMGG
jgi:hypothetical protein